MRGNHTRRVIVEMFDHLCREGLVTYARKHLWKVVYITGGRVKFKVRMFEKQWTEVFIPSRQREYHAWAVFHKWYAIAATSEANAYA